MAGVGRPPKGTRSRERDTRRREDETTTLTATEGEVHGPELPPEALNGEPWHPNTIKLWETLRRSPLLADEPELGWTFLLDTMLMHHQMWTKGRFEFAGELRLRLAKFGATPEDRMRLKVKIQTPEKPENAKPETDTDTASRRKGLRIAQ